MGGEDAWFISWSGATWMAGAKNQACFLRVGGAVDDGRREGGSMIS